MSNRTGVNPFVDFKSISLLSLRPCIATSTLDRRVFIKATSVSMATLAMASAGATIALAGAASAAGAFAASEPQQPNVSDPRELVRRGMRKFEAGDIAGSVEDFDSARAARPSIYPYLWQRGLSLYYLKHYELGAQQFRDDVAVNPNDTEEAIWAFLCEAQSLGAESARAKFLRVGRDSRPVMRAAYETFRDGNGVEPILQAAGNDTEGHAAFYALLYVSLYHESEGNAKLAEEAMVRAVDTRYARESGDYMAALARVHCAQRGWNDE